MLESLFYKVESLQASNFSKKRLLHRSFLLKFAKFLRTPILKNICGRLVLCINYFIIYWFLLFTNGKDTLWNFSFRAFHEIQFQGHFMKHEILSWNTFASVSKFYCVCLSSITKIEFAEKDVFWQWKFSIKFW